MPIPLVKDGDGDRFVVSPASSRGRAPPKRGSIEEMIGSDTTIEQYMTISCRTRRIAVFGPSRPDLPVRSEFGPGVTHARSGYVAYVLRSWETRIP